MRIPVQRQRNETPSLIFGLTDESVEFRNRWRFFVIFIIWIVLSSTTMLLAVFSVTSQIHAAVIVGMSFLKYIPILMVVYNLSKRMAARYLDDVFELHNETLASDFLEEVAFGYGHEKITINEGKIPEKDERSPLILIGGPGLVQVNLDSVALIEKVDGEPKVIYPRNESWKLGRFERIREIGKYDEVGKREYAIINLRDQFVNGLSVKSRTKDGIPLEAQGIKVIFSLLRRQQKDGDKTQSDVDERAVKALVYNQAIITRELFSHPGVTFPWDTTVVPLIITELEELITSRTLSEILATISQVEIDNTSSNDQTISQMRMEMTGQQTRTNASSVKKESFAPNFVSRSKITAQFFEKTFKEKAAKLGVSVEWIDIGTWQLPSSLILDKHKEAWELSQKNAKKRSEVERSGKRHEMEEIIRLVNHVIIENYESSNAQDNKTSKEKEARIKEVQELEKELFDRNPELKNAFAKRETNKKDTMVIALDMLNAFRKELRAAKLSIESDNRSQAEKQDELAKIEKALNDISYLTPHWVKGPS